MLKLQRNFSQRIIIGDDIIVQVSGVRGQKVWLTVQAPKGVSIFREELLSPEAVAEVEKRAREGHTPCQP